MDSLNSLPVSFGKVATKPVRSLVDERINSTKRVDAIDVLAPEEDDEAPVVGEQKVADSAGGVLRRLPDEDDSDDDDVDDDEPDFVQEKEGSDLPVTHEVVMKDHHKTVSALSLDPSGTRVVSGSYDYDAKLWDFGGMNSNFKPFRSWEVTEGHQVVDAQFSTTGDSVLIATGSLQAKLFDRNGVSLGEFVKGDMYIRDLRHTDGHVGAITSLCWHPKNPSLFLTASEDSTLRIWDLNNKRKSKTVIVVKSKERGGKSKVTACAWSADGKWIAAATEDGALNLWLASSNFARPHATAENAHEKGTITSSVVFSPDSKSLASRGGDGTVKLWDIKAFKKPLSTASDLPSLNPQTNVVFSPDGRYLLTGTAGARAGVLSGHAEEEKAKELAALGGAVEGGKVVVLRREGLGVVRRLDISEFSVVKVLWHAKINQILTGSADGSIHVLYSPLTSLRGATLAVSRAPKRRAPDTADIPLDQQQIIAPHSLPMFKEDIPERVGGGKRKRERERHDPIKTMKPMPPITGPGRGGRLGAAATQHVVQGLVWDDTRTQDPREALLKYATTDVNSNTWTSAWSATQPKPVFDTREPTPEPEDKGKGKARK